MPAQYRHHGCRITDELQYKGLRTLVLENELIRVGVLLDKGADIFEFLHKPTDTDFLWRSPQGLINPQRFNPSIASSAGSFLDNYHGGWQEILPGGGPTVYNGAELGLHGEVTQLGWMYDIVSDTPECISVRLSVDCVRTPLRLERTMRLETGKPTLFLEETLQNLSPDPLEFMWGHHPALGEPFLREGVRLFVPAGKGEVHSPAFSGSTVLQPGDCFQWPLAADNGEVIDLSRVAGKEAGFSELIYLQELTGGWYAVVDPQKKLGIGLAWPVDLFPYLWFWLVYGRSPGYPWWSRTYCIALEPWTGIPNNLDQAIARGNQAHLKGGEQISVALCASVITDLETVTAVHLDGTFE